MIESHWIGTFFLKLRSNVALSGDVKLAERDAKNVFATILPVEHPDEVRAAIGLSAYYVALHCREERPIGFLANTTGYSLQELALYLNFIQEVWTEKGNVDIPQVGNWCHLVRDNDREFLCALPVMACGELLSQTTIAAPSSADVSSLAAFLSGERSIRRSSIKAPTGGGTSTPHVHALHKYKAKFFPRLIRSLLVTQCHSLPKNAQGKLTLLDPFAGSGTALIEAALLGIDAVGVDIDKLSCAITQAKIDALTIGIEAVVQAVNEIGKRVTESLPEQTSYRFPGQIARKFERWGTPEEQQHYEATITKWKNSIERLPNETTRRLLGICLSDALTRKFVIRMLGTGVGRFALEIAKTSLDTMLMANFKALIRSVSVAKSLIQAYHLPLGNAIIHHGTAVKLPFENQTFSVILTSPPYLPASSGREDYLVGKAISNIALNLMTGEEIESAEALSVGSMKSQIEQADGLPQAVYHLHDWLAQDQLREIKAKPILAYYIALKQALEENFRVLLPHGLAMYVIGKESVFYRFSTRELLYKVECDKIFAELAQSVGFVVEEQIDVELDKKNKNARPRSLDSYFESVFLLRKPETSNERKKTSYATP